LGFDGVFTGLWVAGNFLATGFDAMAKPESRTGGNVMGLIIFYILLGIMFLVIMWAGARILQKAGFEPLLVMCLLIPVVNVIMIWVFAFNAWPNVKPDTKSLI
jgi:hypothetical protein